MSKVRCWGPSAALLAVISLTPVWANSASSTMVVFSRSGSSTPYYSTWNGTSWSSATAMSSVGANPYWVVLRNCPTRNETACLTMDANDDANLMFYNGSSWTTPVQVSSELVETEDRNCDLAYEQSSGDCLIVYYDAYEGNFGYRTYSGSSLSSETDMTLSGLTESEMIMLYPKPNSNHIMMVAVVRTGTSDFTIVTKLWNGSSWGSWSTLETAATSNDDECVGFAWETSSGDGLIVYGESGSSSPRYRTWNGTSWSSESTLPSSGGGPWWVRLAPDPTSDKIVYAELDSNNDINVNVWSGSSWGSNQEMETSTSAYNRREFDLAYEPDGSKALLVYVESGVNTPRYRTYNGATWTSEQSGPDLGSPPQIIQLRPGASSDEIFVVASDGGNDIEIFRWTGSSMSAKTRIEDNYGGTAITENFMIAVPVSGSLTPANIPYNNDFQSGSSWAEWSTSTTATNTTHTKFLGRFYNSSVDLALNTTSGETYRLTFDLYCNDSWDGSETTNGWGPDYFVVESNGVEAMRHTFSHNNPSYGVTYPYSSDQTGAYAYNTSFNDGIYRTVEVVFTASASVTTLTFSAELEDTSGDIDNESWGIDNVSVEAARFIEVSSSKGFNLQTTTSENDGSGLCWADLDSDGDIDAILGGGGSARLMLNNASGGYVFSNSTFGGGNVREQAALGDFDNDGTIDLYSSEAGGDGYERFFKNSGTASFTNSGDCGLSGPGTNEGCAAGDVNKDGWCDVVMFSDNGNWIGHNQKSSSLSLVGTTSSSYGMNDSGDAGSRGYCASGDVNNDGYLDFFYRYNSGKLFVSDGDGTYTENARGISVATGGYELTAAAWGDYDNDGDLDLFAPNVNSGYTGTLWRNDVTWSGPTGTFTNVTSSAGLTLDNRPAYSANPGTRSGCWGDYDNDGDLDLYIVGANGNGLLYKNDGDGTFTRVGEGLAVSGSGHDAVFVDFDNDGDLDLAVTRQSAVSMLFENRTNNTNYLKVRVIGAGNGRTNKAAIGTRVELWNNSGTTRLARRDVGTARGYGGTEPLWVHFGGVTVSTTYKVKVYFDSGTVTTSVVPASTSTTIGSRTISQMLTVTEEAGVKVIRWREVAN